MRFVNEGAGGRVHGDEGVLEIPTARRGADYSRTTKMKKKGKRIS